MSRNVEIELELPYPVDQVWRALTESDVVATWLMKNNLEPKVGHRFQFIGPPIPGKWNGVVDSQVRIVEPERRLSFTWDTPEQHSTVDIALEPQAHGTRLRLLHEHLADDMAKPLEHGWDHMLRQKLPDAIKKQVAGP